MKRGEIPIAAFPTADGIPPKERPVLVVQADFYDQRLGNVLVAAITSASFVSDGRVDGEVHAPGHDSSSC